MGFPLFYNSAKSSRAAKIFHGAMATFRAAQKRRRRLVLRPGGIPQEISRGQARASGRGPRWPRRTGHAQRGIGEVFGGGCPVASPPLLVVSGWLGGPHPGPFLRCPAGARSHSARFPGAASAGADLPPANLLRCPSGTGTGRPRTDKGKPSARELRFQRVWLRLRRAVFIGSLWFIGIGSAEKLRISCF